MCGSFCQKSAGRRSGGKPAKVGSDSKDRVTPTGKVRVKVRDKVNVRVNIKTNMSYYELWVS